MNWYKKAQQKYGEWWIVNGSAEFADSDTGDIGHEGIVLDFLRREIAEACGINWIEEYYDWEKVKQKAVAENFDKLNEKQKQQMLKDWLVKDKNELIKKVPYEIDIFDNMAKDNGVTEYQLNIAENRIDPRDYGMKILGWKRVANDNIQTWNLTSDDLHSISNGIDDILGGFDWDDSREAKYNIEVGSTGKMYTDVPISVIEKLNPMALRKYELSYRTYAKRKPLTNPSKNRHKKSSLDDIPDAFQKMFELGKYRPKTKYKTCPKCKQKSAYHKEIQEAVGTAYLQVSYSHWHGDIIVEKYFENEYANQEYGKTYRIPIDYNDPEKTIKQTQRAITILS